MKPILVTGLAFGAALILSGCSAQHRKEPPTEQEIHAGDSAVASGAPGRHPFRCDDDREILVDFRDQGLTIELRVDAGAKPIVLTAPTQGLQYVGDTATATFTGNQIRIEQAGKPAMRCRKETVS